VGVVELHEHAVPDQRIDFGVGGDRREGQPPGGDDFYCQIDLLGGNIRVERDGCGAQPVKQDYLTLVCPARAIGEVFTLFGIAVEHVIPVDVLQFLQ